MNRLLATTAIAMLLGVGPAMAVEDSSQPPKASEEAGQTGQPPTTSNVTEDAAKEAKDPNDGTADTSGAAKERSSAPPKSGAVMDSGEADSSTE